MGSIEPVAIVTTLMAARRAELASAVAARMLKMNAEAGRELVEMMKSATEEVARIAAGDPPRGVAQLVDTWA